MKAKNREALKYAKGILNGLTYFTPKAAGEPLATVIEILDAVLEDEAELPRTKCSVDALESTGPSRYQLYGSGSTQEAKP